MTIIIFASSFVLIAHFTHQYYHMITYNSTDNSINQLIRLISHMKVGIFLPVFNFKIAITI